MPKEKRTRSGQATGKGKKAAAESKGSDANKSAGKPVHVELAGQDEATGNKSDSPQGHRASPSRPAQRASPANVSPIAKGAKKNWVEELQKETPTQHADKSGAV